MKLFDKPIVFNRKYTKISIMAGIIFALEFLLLFLALDFTTVSEINYLLLNAIVVNHITFFTRIMKQSHFKIPGINFSFYWCSFISYKF